MHDWNWVEIKRKIWYYRSLSLFPPFYFQQLEMRYKIRKDMYNLLVLYATGSKIYERTLCRICMYMYETFMY